MRYHVLHVVKSCTRNSGTFVACIRSSFPRRHANFTGLVAVTIYAYYARTTRLPTYRRGRPFGISVCRFLKYSYKVIRRTGPTIGTCRTVRRRRISFSDPRTAGKWQQLFNAVKTPRLWNFGFSIPSTPADVVRLRQHNCCFRRRFEFKTTMGLGFPRIVGSKIVFSLFCVGDVFRKLFSIQC